MVRPKKRGRGRPPSGGRDPMVAVRMPTDLRDAVDRWASGQDDKPSRSEAIRRLVLVALTEGSAKYSD